MSELIHRPTDEEREEFARRFPGIAAWLPPPGQAPPPEYLALGETLRALDPLTDKLIAGTITPKEAKRARKALRKAMKAVTR